jgi:FtsP/CotA-like multicopper oxidase with cupredoxin domain
MGEALAVERCPDGTHVYDEALPFNICVADDLEASCPEGTSPAYAGSEICLLDPAAIPKYEIPLVIPPVMPTSKGSKVDYNIAVRQFQQQILPGGIWNSIGATDATYPATTVWSYGRAEDAVPAVAPSLTSSFNYPAFTIEATKDKLTRVRWINDLQDANGPLHHLLPVDQTLHWANPSQMCMDGTRRTDCMGMDPAPYLGPVPMVPHVHGAHVHPESDGYPEAWWLPASAKGTGYAMRGRLYEQWDRSNKVAGSALYGYPNNQRAGTNWYHDHSLGMTRSNVYAGPAGFWLIRGNRRQSEPDLVHGVLPGPAPVRGDDPNLNAATRAKIREIPVVIQDRSFNPDGSLFYPPNRAFFEGVNKADLQIPFIPDLANTSPESPADISAIWNPEAFFTTMVVNGTVWPSLTVENEQYRFRLLNGCNSRFLNLSLFVVEVDDSGNIVYGVNGIPTKKQEVPFHVIGTEGGLLPNVVSVQTEEGSGQALLVALAERFDVIVDFRGLEGKTVVMFNTGPDEPFGGFPIELDSLADPVTTGQVMAFRVVDNDPRTDPSTPWDQLVFAPRVDLVTNAPARRLSLNEEVSGSICASLSEDGTITEITEIPGVADGLDFEAACENAGGEPFGPKAALLGTFDVSTMTSTPLRWGEDLTEKPQMGAVEQWELYNTTMDAHPMHLHLVQFQVGKREVIDETLSPNGDKGVGYTYDPQPWEAGWKDMVVAYPGEITRLTAKFDVAGLYVWHCHIVEHEDNEMMRPYVVVATPDLDNNGVVNLKDLAILVKKLALRLPSPANLAYDLNGDGAFDLKDTQYLLTQRGPWPK